MSSSSHSAHLGLVARLEAEEPGIRQRIIDEGFDARARDQKIDTNPYHQDGKYGWWREGWFNGDDALKSIGDHSEPA